MTRQTPEEPVAYDRRTVQNGGCCCPSFSPKHPPAKGRLGLMRAVCQKSLRGALR